VDSDPSPVDNLGNTADTPHRSNMSEASGNFQSVTTGLVEVSDRPETFLLKGAEVRDLLHISRTTLHEWRVKGRLHAVRHHDRGIWMYPADQDVIVNALRAVGSIR